MKIKALSTIKALSAVSAIAVTVSPLQAQRVEQRFALAQDTAHEVRGNWPPMRIAKWTTLIASTAAAAYGFAENRVADRDYEELERICEADPSACLTTADGTVYADPALETRYQDVVRRDDRARTALLLGQLGIAASVLLFIIDLPESATAEDIPYQPRPLVVGLIGGRPGLSVTIAIR